MDFRCGAVPLGLVCTLLFSAATFSCKDGSKERTIDPSLAQAAAAAQAEQLARRDALLKSRDELNEKKGELEAKIAQARGQGSDTSDLDRQLRDLANQQSANRDAIIEHLTQSNERLQRELDSLRTSGEAAGGQNMSQLVSQLQRRDSQLAEMEKRLASVVSQLGDIRGDIQKQAQACAAAPATTIVAAPVQRGAKYARADVERELGRARSAMSKRGILGSDLPGAASELQKEATGSMGDGDFNAAYIAARTLAQTVDAIRVDRAFIADKMARLSRVMKGKSLSADAEQAFKDATDAYNNGKFDVANRRLNAIAQAL